jgi:cystathionine gamma-synthase
MISFRLKSAKLVAQVLEKVRIISFAESLGGVESLITYPILQTHSDVPEQTRRRLGIDDRLLRLSVGIEHIDDLCADLKQAL